MSWIRSFVSVLIICIFLTSGDAQESTFPIKLDLNNSLLDRKTRSPFSRHETKKQDPPKSLHPLINLDLRLRIYRPSLPDYWTTYANQPHEIVITQYRGLHGVIYKQIKRQAHKYYGKMLRNYWNQSELHPMDLAQEIKNYTIRSSDYGHRWWEQRNSFIDYLPKEKGGARVVYHTIGERYQLFSIGPIEIHNTGKVSWAGWRFSISSEEDKLKEKPNKDLDGVNQPIIRTSERHLLFGIKPPKGNIYTGDLWTVSGSVNFNLRLDNFKNNGSSIKGQIRIIGFYGIRKTPWFNISVRATLRPFREQYSASLNISLIQW